MTYKVWIKHLMQPFKSVQLGVLVQSHLFLWVLIIIVFKSISKEYILL